MIPLLCSSVVTLVTPDQSTAGVVSIVLEMVTPLLIVTTSLEVPFHPAAVAAVAILRLLCVVLITKLNVEAAA
jgi:hypothetical protein